MTIKVEQNKRKLIILIALIALVLVIGGVMARYISKADSSSELEIAHFIVNNEVQNQTLKLESMVPREEPYNYSITISNTKNEKVSETAIEYYIQIKATTNLPLQFSLTINKNNDQQIVTTETLRDEDGMYYVVMSTDLKEFGLTKEEHNYILSIIFPTEYKANSEYADVIELVEITVDSKQKI